MFLLLQSQSTMHCCHHCTLLLFAGAAAVLPIILQQPSQSSSLLSLLLPPPLPFQMADCFVSGGWGLTLSTLSSPLGCCCLLLSSPCPPHQEHMMETCKGGRGCGGNCLGVNTALMLGSGRAGKVSKIMFSWSSLLRTSLETVFFCKNGQSYKKNQNWRLLMHVQLNSMCADNCQLMNESTSSIRKRLKFCNHGGGAFFHGVKKLEAFSCSSFRFWLRKMLLGCPEQKMFPAKSKSGGNQWAGPLNGGVYHHLDIQWGKLLICSNFVVNAIEAVPDTFSKCPQYEYGAPY
jgi:hypothetical protein